MIRKDLQQTYHRDDAAYSRALADLTADVAAPSGADPFDSPDPFAAFSARQDVPTETLEVVLEAVPPAGSDDQRSE